jgi:peptidoglycan/LPS O-acetylase OafA/YrhL
MKSKFYDSLEGFRGISVLLVLISHFLIISHFPKFIFLNFGFLGVNFFFVLSGFLITEILMNEIEKDGNTRKIIKNFYLKRTIRIFPIYYLSIIGLSIFNIQGLRELLPWTLTYSTNIGSVWFGKGAGIIGHFWSLCVEEQFYLFWPLLLIIFRKKHLYLFIAIIIVSVSAKFIYLVFNGPNIRGFIHDSTPAALDALSFGALLAYLKNNKPDILNKVLKHGYIPVSLIFFFWIMLYSYHEFSFFYCVFGRFIASIIAFYLVGWGALNTNNLFIKITKTHALRYFGKISYGIYVYHLIIFGLLAPYYSKLWDGIKGKLGVLGYQNWFFSFIFFSALSIIVATVSYYFIERPLLKLKKKIR